MREVQRRGVTIDLCRDCRGVYLDRGELDKLLDTIAAEPPQPVIEDHTPRDAPGRHRKSEDPWRDDRDNQWEKKRRRRRGWLEELFDLD